MTTLRRAFGAARRRILCSAHRRLATLGAGPYVSFAFDDFPRTAYTAGGSILKHFGVRGTYYVAMGLINTSNGLGEQFRMDDLHAVADDGHELASHTFSHTPSRAVGVRTFWEDVRKGRSSIRGITGLTATDNFAYPCGEVTLAAKRVVGREMTSCRGIFPGINGPLVDLNLLKANSLYGDLDRFDALHRLIETNERGKGWLILYTHDVCPTPSRYGCTPRLFEAVVRSVTERGARVLPVTDVLTKHLE
jgi:peptidoglycan/xylan/chitin deacetylase (PgdA/CDA1 family)